MIRHFKLKHDLTTNSIYRCSETGCNQAFQNLRNFKKHMNRKHLSCIDSIEEENNQNIFIDGINNTFTEKYCIGSYDTPLLNKKNTQYAENNNDPEVCNGRNEEYCVEDIINKLNNSVAVFFLAQYDNDNFTRKDVLDIHAGLEKNILEPLLNSFKIFGDFFLIKDSMAYNKLCGFLALCKHLLKPFQTDHFVQKWLKENNLKADLQEFVINSEISVQHKQGRLDIDKKDTKGILLPLKFQLQTFFEKRNVLSSMLHNIKTLENDKSSLSNFVQGILWKNKKQLYPDKTLIPYFLYIDDVEINNPLGSKSKKHAICNIYYSFPCTPTPESKLKNVFLAAILKSVDVKSFGNEASFRSLVNELRQLETDGLEIKIGEKIFKVYFILGLVFGDNLGLNSFLNFSESFASNYYCRLCKISKLEAQKLVTCNNLNLRSIEDYENEVRNLEHSSVKSNCPLNIIPSFHVVQNFYVDVMHDLFEGVCHYNLCHVITYLVEKMNFFSLDVLNHRKQTFEYGQSEIQNASGELKKKCLDKFSLKMTAREMMTFVLHFPLMVGDLVPSDDVVWKFLLNFVEIIEMLLCFEITDLAIVLLQQKIEIHHKDYILLFNDSLKPKHHNLTHYPEIIRQSGPLRKLWCFKFEAKHRQFKVYSHCITSRKNICLSLARKYELKFAYQMFTFENHDDQLIDIGNISKIDSKYGFIISEKMNLPKQELNAYSKISFRGTEFRINQFVVTFSHDFIIYIIKEIVIKNNKPYLFCQHLVTNKYLEHFLAFEVDTNSLAEFKIIEIDNLVGPPLELIKTARGKSMLKCKEYYKSVF